jgi:hypothetical protein
LRSGHHSGTIEFPQFGLGGLELPQQHDNWFTTPPTRMGVELRRFRCDGCGYGASRRTEPTRCPMCGGADWAEEAWRPSEALVHDLDPALFPMQREADAIGLLPGVPLS